MIDFENPVNTKITSDKINFKFWSIYPIHQYHKYRFYSLCKSAPLYLKRRKIRLNLANLMEMTMSRHPQTVTDAPLLQPVVFAVLQFQGAGKVKFLQDCKNCKWRFSLAGIHKRVHHERTQFPSTEIPSGQDRLSGAYSGGYPFSISGDIRSVPS